MLIRGGSGADRIASGEADMAVQNVSELMHVAGVQLAGPFPAEDQNEAFYTAGVSAKSAQLGNARGFVGYITRPEAADVWKGAGFDP